MANLTSSPAISVRGLRKSFGDHVVLDGIDLDIVEGTIFSLLGPNGAGKTTMIQILSTLIRLAIPAGPNGSRIGVQSTMRGVYLLYAVYRPRKVGKYMRNVVIQTLARVTPPSRTMVWPVTQAASSEARYATAPATSSGTPSRLRG